MEYAHEFSNLLGFKINSKEELLKKQMSFLQISKQKIMKKKIMS